MFGMSTESSVKEIVKIKKKKVKKTIYTEINTKSFTYKQNNL